MHRGNCFYLHSQLGACTVCCIVPQVFGSASLCLPVSECMHSGRVCVCEFVCPCCAHACTAPAREQCVMTPTERCCVKRCNVCVRRRCQHHRPLSWPGFLTQRFLSQLIGPDTNFLAELQCGRSNLITGLPGSTFDCPTSCQSHLRSSQHLMSSFNITSDCPTPVCPQHSPTDQT